MPPGSDGTLLRPRARIIRLKFTPIVRRALPNILKLNVGSRALRMISRHFV
jgi:hypothetical protein